MKNLELIKDYDYVSWIKLPEEYRCSWINSEFLYSNNSVLIHNTPVRIRHVTCLIKCYECRVTVPLSTHIIIVNMIKKILIISCTTIYNHLRTQAFIMNQMKKNKSKDCVSVIQAINNWIIVKVLLLVAQLLICMYSASVQDLTCVTAIVHVHWHHDACGANDMQYRSTYILSVDYYNIAQSIDTIYWNNEYIYNILHGYISKCPETNRITVYGCLLYSIADYLTLLLLNLLYYNCTCIMKSTNSIVYVGNYSEMHRTNVFTHHYVTEPETIDIELLVYDIIAHALLRSLHTLCIQAKMLIYVFQTNYQTNYKCIKSYTKLQEQKFSVLRKKLINLKH